MNTITSKRYIKKVPYVVHDSFGYKIKKIEEVKYLESTATTNLLRADKNKRYNIVQLEVENIGDRETSGDFLDPMLYVYDNNNAELDASEDYVLIAKYYLEQYGQIQVVPTRDIQRGQVFDYIIAYD